MHARRRLVALAAAVGILAAACGGDDGSSDTTTPAETTAPADTSGGDSTSSSAAPSNDPLQVLYEECKETGKVNLIALPDDWANYKGILQSFRDKYPGIENPVANPDASSRDELEAVQTLAGQANMPDNVDVSPAIAQEMVDLGLFEPYVLTTDGEIPEGLKDGDDNWVASYYGIMALVTNVTIVDEAPTTFDDLRKPEYKGLVALNGDPRASGAAFAAVMAASIANGGSADDIMPGIEFFAELKTSGNLGATDVTRETILSGETPIAIDWSYNVPGLADALAEAGLEVEVNFPSDGIYGGFYAQGVVKDSPNQACSKLWLEHLNSDEGGLGYLEGGAVPARIVSLTDRGLVTDEAKKNLPPEDLLDQVAFLTPNQIAKAKADLEANWGPMVADS
jgi:putative spermidine/putrescine transport system substrate-binding protein